MHGKGCDQGKKKIIQSEYSIINELSVESNIKSLCKYMGVSRSGYYKWGKRKGKLNRYEQDRVTLGIMVKDVHSKHGTWGYHRIATLIRNQTGWIFSDWLCHKVCKELTIRSKAKYIHGEEHLIYPNVINGAWNAARPFEKIVTDTTLIKNKYGKKDLNLYIDVFNNEIVAYDLRASKKGNGTKNHLVALKMLLREKKKRGYKDLETIIHSDQGAVYTSTAYNHAYKNYNIKRSMSRIATPTDNAKNEAINGWMKDELYKDFKIYMSRNLDVDIRKYIHHYNHERPAYALKYKTPIHFKTELGFK
ncbi:IS3 family transposase [Mycoplasmatota bacterium zrk1]